LFFQHAAQHHHNAEKDIYFLGRILRELKHTTWWAHVDLESYHDLRDRVTAMVCV
jgi:hypothetical protein